MKTKRTRTTGRNITTIALSATLATAGLGLASAGIAWAEEPAQDPAAAVSETADPAATSEPTETPAESASQTPAESTSETTQPTQTSETPAPAETSTTITPITDVQVVTIELTNDVTTATTLYDQINAVRAEQGLPALTRSVALEDAAWQRAAESVVLAADVRPDGTAVSAVSPSAGITGETLLAGDATAAGSAQAATTAWLADADASADLLSSAHASVGVGLVRDAAGTYHWAVVYGDTADAQAEGTARADGTWTYDLTVPTANLTAAGTTTLQAQVDAGATLQLAPGVRLSGELSPTEAPGLAFDNTQPLALNPTTVTWQTADAAIATVDANGTVTGVANGITQVSAVSAQSQVGTTTWDVTVGDGVPAQTEPAQEEAPAEEPPTDPAQEEPVVDPTLDAEGEQTGDSGDETSTLTDPELADPAGETPADSTAADGSSSEADSSSDSSASDSSVTDESAGSDASQPGDADGSSDSDDASDSSEEADARIDLASCNVLGITDAVANADGSPVTPAFSVSAPDGATTLISVSADGTVTGSLVKDVDYTYAFSNNTAAGEATLTITALPDSTQVTGEITKTFNIAPLTTDLASAGFAIGAIGDQTYTGEPIEIVPSVMSADGATTLVEGTDYTVSYAASDGTALEGAPTNPGTYMVVVTGTGSYAGQLTANFNVIEPAPTDLTSAGFAIAPIADLTQPEEGTAVKPEVSVSDGTTTLVEGTDYTVSYAASDGTALEGAPTNPGTYVLTVSGIGDYAGTLTANFNVLAPEKTETPAQPTDIRSATISAIEDQTFTGQAITPQVSVSHNGTALTQGTDYTVSYENNVNAGTARVVITGIGAYTGTTDTTFVIKTIEMTQVEIVMPNQYYTGKALSPKPISVTAQSGYTLTEGVDYQIIGYANNTKVGKAGVTLRGLGNFTGTVVAAFEIVERPADNQQATQQDAGKTTTLPKTGDATSPVPIVVASVAGVALVGAGIGLAVSRRRRDDA